MSTTATVPSTIHIRPSRLAGLLAAVAILTGITTWSVSQVTTESHAPSSSNSYLVSSPDPATKAYLEGLGATESHAPSSSNSHLVSSPDPATKAYLEGLGALDAEQRAAIYGNVYANQSQQRLDAEAKLGINLDDFDKAEQDFLIALAAGGEL